MALPVSVVNNLRFLIVEVGSQLEQLITYFESESEIVGQRILSRSGYGYNLKMRIQNGCMLQLAGDKRSNSTEIRAMSVKSPRTLSA